MSPITNSTPNNSLVQEANIKAFVSQTTKSCVLFEDISEKCKN